MFWFFGHSQYFQRSWKFFSKLEFGRLGIFRYLYKYWLLSTNISILKLINAYHTRNVPNHACWCIQAGTCDCLLCFLWRWSCNSWVNQPSKLLTTTISPLFYLILNVRHNKIPPTAQHAFIIFVRTAVLDSQPVTISVVLDSWCSKMLHRTMLAWLSRHQSDIMCSINFVTNHGVEIASNVLIPK